MTDIGKKNALEMFRCSNALENFPEGRAWIISVLRREIEKETISENLCKKNRTVQSEASLEQKHSEVLQNRGAEFVARDMENGIFFEIVRCKNGFLECYIYPAGKQEEKRLFAKTTRTMDFRDFLLFCEYRYAEK